MILGLGTDIVAVHRIERVIQSNPRFIEKVFSSSEQHYCSSKANPFQSYAARFAAKEAFMKALGTGWDEGICWTEIEVVNDARSKPGLALSGATKALALSRGTGQIFLSLSHEKDYAIATVILEKKV
ncbi:MAG: holo-ACP synthase [Candidatus Cloacimonadaceae bacterium]|jgi:holo-[acyl-carrier protein] synthase|nr:holo-ACP synthase [Candidatus Cloacimonadota bacterium]MDY0127754.1 holo-ACP synthase [Candidatus Cloacimonadaceae bacterium]MCB5255821.1 holo-ACP synthase [Candidatus Cloacimonadota bacterium]MCK9178076.1 holo-ACP synthase [Candidatus Cloacimonadota bacterium]MCK9242296.1 holo-ACP synthase [Candidatus Cloacimonadota bacterium]